MPMGQMFGAPVGAQIAKEERRAAELHELSLDKGNLELEKAQLELSSQKRMLELMSQPKDPASASDKNYELAEKMDSLAEMALASGLPEKAKDYALAGSTLRKNTDDINKARLDATIKGMTFLSSLMEGVKDERSWRQALMMFKKQTGQDTPYAQQRYSPQLVQQIRLGLLNAKDKALMEAAKARIKATEAIERERDARIPLIKAQTDLARAREKKLDKAGATQQVPKAGDVQMITDLIITDYRATMPEEARRLARPVAERMLEILKDTRITKSQAANRAYQEAKSGGHFGGLRVTAAQPGTKENPLDLPDKDYSKLKTNRFYKGKGKLSGKVLLWNGSSFQEVTEDYDADVVEDEDLDELEDEELSEDDTMAAVEAD